MTGNILAFENAEFGIIRTQSIDGNPWFVGKDVATALGYTDCDQAIRNHVDVEDKLTRCFDGSGQKRTMTIINESGLYSLIFSSKLESAKRFKRWVTSTVLPSIRKTGGYLAGQEQLTNKEIMARALILAQKQIEKANARIAILEEKNRNSFGAEIIRKDSISVGEYATFLRQNGVNIGRNRLFAYFFENGYMTRGSRSEEHFPTKKSLDLGLFEMSGRTIKVSLLGRKYFNEVFLTNAEQSSCYFTRRTKP